MGDLDEFITPSLPHQMFPLKKKIVQMYLSGISTFEAMGPRTGVPCLDTRFTHPPPKQRHGSSRGCKCPAGVQVRPT